MKSPDSPLLCPCCAGLHSYTDRDTLIQHLAYDHSSVIVARDFGFMIAEKQKAVPIEKIDTAIAKIKHEIDTTISPYRTKDSEDNFWFAMGGQDWLDNMEDKIKLLEDLKK